MRTFFLSRCRMRGESVMKKLLFFAAWLPLSVWAQGAKTATWWLIYQGWQEVYPKMIYDIARVYRESFM